MSFEEFLVEFNQMKEVDNRDLNEAALVAYQIGA